MESASLIQYLPNFPPKPRPVPPHPPTSVWPRFHSRKIDSIGTQQGAPELISWLTLNFSFSILTLFPPKTSILAR